MANKVEVVELKVIGEEELEKLSNLLQVVVNDGASIGFLPPLKKEVARQYWQNVIKPNVRLFVAKIDDEIVGSVQLHLETKENGIHRAEICKLMTHPQFRRKGIGMKLMEAAEKKARQENRLLLVLDTREGDPSNLLYLSLDYMESGKVPKYARSANGELHTTVFYYKYI